MKHHCFAIRLAVAALAAVGLAAPVAAGEQVPFRARFTGIGATVSVNFPIVNAIVRGTGNATHLGKFAFEHPHTVNRQDFTIAGPFHLLSANGDEVFADFSGQASETPTPGVLRIVGTATITGGTGRFEGATGSFGVQRLFNFNTSRTVGTFDGTISSPGASQQ